MCFADTFAVVQNALLSPKAHAVQVRGRAFPRLDGWVCGAPVQALARRPSRVPIELCPRLRSLWHDATRVCANEREILVGEIFPRLLVHRDRDVSRAAH